MKTETKEKKKVPILVFCEAGIVYLTTLFSPNSKPLKSKCPGCEKESEVYFEVDE